MDGAPLMDGPATGRMRAIIPKFNELALHLWIVIIHQWRATNVPSQPLAAVKEKRVLLEGNSRQCLVVLKDSGCVRPMVIRCLAKTRREKSEEAENEEGKGGKTVCNCSKIMIQKQEKRSLLVHFSAEKRNPNKKPGATKQTTSARLYSSLIRSSSSAFLSQTCSSVPLATSLLLGIVLLTPSQYVYEHTVNYNLIFNYIGGLQPLNSPPMIHQVRPDELLSKTLLSG